MSSYFIDNGEEISKKWGAPKGCVSCPGCGQTYGHHKTKVCLCCEECSRCCTCGAYSCHEPADKAVPKLLERS